MKYLKITNAALIFAIILLASSCKKVDYPSPLNGAGGTFVKIFGAEAPTGYKLLALQSSTTPQLIEMVEVRRDVPTSAELDKPLTVILTDDPGAVSDYDPSSTIVSLPDNTYTVDPSTPRLGNNYTVTFAPGEFSKFIKFNINTSLLNLSERHAMGFNLSAINGNGSISTDKTTYVVEIGVKNDWDGTYTSQGGYFYHPTAPRALTVNATKSASTSGPYSVETELGDFDGVHQGATTYYLTLTIDPATNNVTAGPGSGAAPSPNPIVSLSALPTTNPGYTPFAGSTPSIYTNKYDPATKTFYLRYGYTNALGVWRVVEEVLVKN